MINNLIELFLKDIFAKTKKQNNKFFIENKEIRNNYY
jgi:hypothetical protein